MQIKSINVKNFLCIEDVNLDLKAPLNLITGENEAGKSSLRDAIQWALTKQARTLKTHEQQAHLIHDGAKAAEVVITLADGRTISVKKTPKSPGSWVGPLPDDQAMASILCDPLAFLSLEDKVRREILFRMLPGLNPAAKDIQGRLFSCLFPGRVMESDRTEIPLDQWNILEELSKLAASQGFKAAESEAVNRRVLAKRIIKEFQVEEPRKQADINGVSYILPDIKAEQVQKQLTTLQADRDKLLKQRGKIEARTDSLPELESELEALEAEPVEAPPEGEAKEWEEGLKVNREILADLSQKVEGLENGSPGVLFPTDCAACKVPCPSAGQEAIAPTKPSDPVHAEKLRAQLQEQIEQVARLEKGLEGARAKDTTYQGYQARVQDLGTRIAKLKEEEGQAAATAELDAQIEKLDDRMKTGYALLDAVRDFWRQKEAADQAREKIDKAEKEILLYDALAKALAPAGIPSQLIAEALGPVNAHLEFASGYLFPDTDPLKLTDDLEIVRGTTPAALLSKSARYRAGVALQYTLARLAGARLLLIDEADLLDAENRANLIEFLMEIRPDFDTVLVFATTDHAIPSSHPDLQVWVIVAGQVQSLNEGYVFEAGQIVKDAGREAA